MTFTEKISELREHVDGLRSIPASFLPYPEIPVTNAKFMRMWTVANDLVLAYYADADMSRLKKLERENCRLKNLLREINEMSAQETI